MLGGYLWRFLQWLGLWNCYITSWISAIRRLVGHDGAAIASRRALAVRRTTARSAVLPRVSLGDAGFVATAV